MVVGVELFLPAALRAQIIAAVDYDGIVKIPFQRCAVELVALFVDRLP